MVLRIGDVCPNFTANTTQSEINWHDWLGDSWGILFSHPADFTPVCTTELARAASLQKEFTDRNTKVACYSCDTVEDHTNWCVDIEKYADGAKVWFPIIEGVDRKIGLAYDMLDEGNIDKAGLPLTVRSVFFIGMDKKIKAIITYPASTGRNFDEIIRVIDSLQMAPKYSLATPENWKPGKRCVIAPSVSNEQAKEKFGEFETIFPYLRMTKSPADTVKNAKM